MNKLNEVVHKAKIYWDDSDSDSRRKFLEETYGSNGYPIDLKKKSFTDMTEGIEQQKFAKEYLEWLGEI
jgi:hypothetical protein